MSDAKKKLLALARLLPPHLFSDWKGTNHFELTDRSDGRGWFWLDLNELGTELRDDTEQGRRVGLLMDVAAAAAAWAAEKGPENERSNTDEE